MEFDDELDKSMDDIFLNQRMNIKNDTKLIMKAAFKPIHEKLDKLIEMREQRIRSRTK